MKIDGAVQKFTKLQVKFHTTVTKSKTNSKYRTFTNKFDKLLKPSKNFFNSNDLLTRANHEEKTQKINGDSNITCKENIEND